MPRMLPAAVTLALVAPRAANAFRVVPPEQELCAADSLLVVAGTVVDSGRFRKTSDGRRKIVTLRTMRSRMDSPRARSSSG